MNIWQGILYTSIAIVAVSLGYIYIYICIYIYSITNKTNFILDGISAIILKAKDRFRTNNNASK